MRACIPNRRGLAVALLTGVLSFPVGVAHSTPSQLATSFDSGAGTPAAVAIDDTGLFVAVAGSSGLVVWDLRAVADGAQSSGLCSGSGAVDVLYVPSDSYGERFYVVCGGGGVEHVTLDSSTIPVSLSASDEIEVNLGSGGSIGLAFAPIQKPVK